MPQDRSVIMAKKSAQTPKHAESRKEDQISNLFGPCGMFCGFCSSYLAKRNDVPHRRGILSYCDGCRPRDKMCSFLKKRCPKLLDKKVTYCFECGDFPCANLKHIDARYQSTYPSHYSLLKTLSVIKAHGEEVAFKQLQDQYRCEKCGELKCVHNNLCYKCDGATLATMKNYKNE